MNHLPTDSKERKGVPLFSGLMKYFPDALAAVARVSFLGNEQHNPGEPLHWAREKSTDHEDCVARHLLDVGTLDDDGQKHAAKMAWRALAVLQLECEADTIITKARQGANPAVEIPALPPFDPMPNPDCPCDVCHRLRLAKDGEVVAVPMFDGIPMHAYDRLSGTDSPNVKVTGVETGTPTCYEIGPMTGYENFNFAAFDEGRDVLTELGWDVISPADLDREAGIDPLKISDTEAYIANFTIDDLKKIIRRDVKAILSLNPEKGDALALLPGWEKSTGSMGEVMLGRWLGLRFIHALTGEPVMAADIDFRTLAGKIYDYFQGKEGLK